jgi:hypothetical protein
MKDPVIVSKVDALKDLVAKVNDIMLELQNLNVEVRIAYVAKNDPNYSTRDNTINQSINLWKVEEHNGYL